MKKLFLLLFLFSSLSGLFAQNGGETVTVNKNFILFKVTERSGDTVVGLVYAPGGIKLTRGVGGNIMAMKGSEKSREGASLGSGTVLGRYEKTDFYMIYMVNRHPLKNDSLFRIKTDDYINLPVAIAATKNPSLFRRIDLWGITHLNSENDYFANTTELLNRNDKKFEDSLIAVMANDLRITGKKYAEYKDTSLTKKASSGRYKGKNMLEVFQNCKPEDVKNFLYYIVSFPSGYTGRSYSLANTFGGWVSSNAPESVYEIYETLTANIKNTVQLKKLLEKFRPDLIDRGYYSNMMVMADEQKNDGNPQVALAMYNNIGYFAKLLKDPMMIGVYCISKAQVLQELEQYQPALNLCDTAIVVLKNTNDVDYMYYQSLIKKAFLLRKLKDQKNSLAISEKAEKELYNDRLIKDSIQFYTIKGRIYRDKGNTYYSAEDYNKAIEAYATGIEAYKKIASYNSNTSIAELQSNIADVYQLQNRNAEAETMYRQLGETYRDQSDGLMLLTTIAKVAYLQSKQGLYQKAIYNYNTAYKYYKTAELWDKAGFYLSQIGQTYWSLGMYDSAIDAHQKALQLQYMADSKEDKAYAWGKLGSLYSLSGLQHKALLAQDSALYYAYQGKDTLSAIDYLLEMGDTYEGNGDKTNAFKNYKKAEELAKKIKSKSRLLNTTYTLAGYHFETDTTLSANYYRQASLMAEQMNNKEKQVYTALNLGILQNIQLKYREAELFFKKAFSIARTEKDISQTAECYAYLGDAAVQRLRYDSAIFFYKTSYHLYDSILNKQKLSPLKAKLGDVLIEQLAYTNAQKEYEKALELATDNKNETDKSNALSSLSYLHLIQGNNKMAKAYLDKVKAISDSTKNDWLLATLNISYGNYYSSFFENEKAIMYYQKADSFYIVRKSIASRLTCLNNIGNIYLLQRDNDKALNYLNEGIKIAEKANTINDIYLLLKLNACEAFFNKKEYTKAMALATECESIATKTGARRRLNAAQELQGMISFKKGDYKNARLLLNKTVAVSMENKNIAGAASSYIYLARIAKEEKKYTEAFEHIEKAKEGYEFSENDNGLWEVYYETGNIYFLQNNNDSAIENYKKAVTIVTNLAGKLIGTDDEKNKLKSEETKTDLFNKLIAACVKANRIDDAVYFTNLANLQGIKDKSGEAGISSVDNKEQEEIDKAKGILQQKNIAKEKLEKEKAKPAGQQNDELIESLVKVIKTAEEDYENYIDDLATKYDALKEGFAESVNPQKFAAYKKSIPDSVACLLYIINQNQLYIFTVTNKETKAVTVELNTDIDSIVNSLRLALKHPEAKFTSGPLLQRSFTPDEDENGKIVDYNNVAAKLYRLLIKPVAEIIEGKKTLCIIPTGRLSLIPFQVLSYKKNDIPRFLIEDYEIFYTNQLEVFYEKNSAIKNISGLSAFGNPDKTLPNAETEVNNLKEMFSKENYYTQDAATETQARQSLVKDKFLHFATHGMLDYNDFRNSYLVFATNNENDPAQNGKLTIREIKSLKIVDCELVTLSACESGVNKEISKGWYISPANSFLVKGVKTVVASLWKVHDEATSLLMTEFYKNLPHMSKAQALRHAQITLTQNPKYQHPYYWAPFLLYGSWQ